MQLNDITEEMVVQWLHREREGRGLKALALSVYAAGKEHGVFHDVTTHAEGCCAIAGSISDSALLLGRKIKDKQTQKEAQNA